jgi:hypothetical protein
VRELAEGERLKLGAVIVSAMVAVLVAIPDVPMTFTAYTPGVAVAFGVKVSVTWLVGVAEDRFNLVPIPAGTPDRVRFTLVLASPTGLTTPIVLLPLLPPTKSWRVLAEDERLKLGAGTVTEKDVVRSTVPEVPVTLTV